MTTPMTPDHPNWPYTAMPTRPDAGEYKLPVMQTGTTSMTPMTDEDDCYSADWDDDGEYEDCALMPDGQCMKAGTEECDWDCGRLG